MMSLYAVAINKQLHDLSKFIKLLSMNVENLQCRDRVANQTCNRIVAVNK